MTDPQPAPQQQKNSFNPLVIVGIAVLVIIVGGAFVASQGNRKNSSPQQPDQQIAQVEPTRDATTESAANVHAASDSSKEVSNTINFTVEGGDFYFKPNQIRIKKGQQVTITFNNAAGFHNFVLDEFNVKSATIPVGQTTQVSFTPDTVGSFEFYCNIDGHRAKGMKGTLIVE